MRKLFWLFMMLVLAGCGSGGGTPAASGTPAAGATGSVSLQFVQQAQPAPAKTVAALADVQPGRVRVVLTSNSLDFKRVVDIVFGTAPEAINLPVASDYTLEAVYYSSGTPNLLTDYGAVTAPITVASGQTTALAVTMLPITVAMTAPDSVLSGGLYNIGPVTLAEEATLASELALKGLQPKWSLAVRSAGFPDRAHLAQTPSVRHTGIQAPVVDAAGSLFFQGEFFIKETLLDAGESATNWAFVTEPATPTALLLGAANAPIGLPADDQEPKIVAFSVPQEIQGTNIISPVSIIAVDNAEVASYMITQSNVKPARDSALWGPASKNYTASVVVTNTNQSLELFAWVKDPSGNVSSAIDKVTNKTVILNNQPVVTSFAVPTATQFTTQNIPVTIAGKSYTALKPQYQVTESSVAPTSGWSDPDATTGIYAANYSLTTITPATQLDGIRYIVPVYAWAKDANGVSLAAKNSVVVNNAPQVTGLTAPVVLGGKTVTISTFTAQAAPGRTIANYLITKTSAKPLPGDFVLTAAPATFVYDGLPAGVTVSKPIYAWVKDSAGVISLSKAIPVRFNAPIP